MAQTWARGWEQCHQSLILQKSCTAVPKAKCILSLSDEFDFTWYLSRARPCAAFLIERYVVKWKQIKGSFFPKVATFTSSTEIFVFDKVGFFHVGVVWIWSWKSIAGCLWPQSHAGKAWEHEGRQTALTTGTLLSSAEASPFRSWIA